MYERYKILIKNAPESVTNINSKFNVIKGNENNNKKCPYCDSNKIIKFGFYKGIQRYKCNNDECGRTFSGDSNNPFRCSKKFKDNWEEYFNLITKGLSLRECAKKMNITIVTSFFWRHRFLHDLVRKNYKEKISGPYIELTQFVTLENFKGDRKFHEEKRDKIIVINALNDKIEILPIMGGRKFFGANQLRDNLIPRLDKKAYTVGFINGRLKNFCRALNVVNKVKINKEEIISKVKDVREKQGRLVAINGYVDKDKNNIVVYTLEYDNFRKHYHIKGETILPTVTNIYKGAQWFEEEIQEMMPLKFEGLIFSGRLFLPEEFKEGEGQILIMPLNELKKLKDK